MFNSVCFQGNKLISSQLSLPFEIQGNQTCSLENLAFHLKCNKCQAKRIDPTANKKMVSYMISKSIKKKPVAQHTITHDLDLYYCYTTNTIRSASKSLITINFFETATSQLNLMQIQKIKMLIMILSYLFDQQIDQLHTRK